MKSKLNVELHTFRQLRHTRTSNNNTLQSALRILFAVITCSLHNNSLNESFKHKLWFGRRRRSETQIKFGYINVVEKVYLQTTEDFSQT